MRVACAYKVLLIGANESHSRICALGARYENWPILLNSAKSTVGDRETQLLQVDISIRSQILY